jgi:hypothetical protein
MPDETHGWEGEFDEEGQGYLVGSADCHYYNPANDLSDDGDGEQGIKRYDGEDWGDVFERWYEEALDSMVDTAPPHAHLASESTHIPPTMCGWTSHHARVHGLACARAVGPPPRREQFTDATAFQSARAGWFEHYTGQPLAVVGSEAEQRRAWDNVTRAWRVYTDGRQSLGAPIWDGHVSHRAQRMQDANAVAVDTLLAASWYV